MSESLHAARTAVDQAVPRVHLGDSIRGARLFWHCRARRGALAFAAALDLAWVPAFPISERLNALTAGCLLALMAVPTIFSLAEDALNNVPRGFKEGRMRSVLKTSPDDHPHPRARVAFRHHLGGAARFWPRDWRDDGRAALRGQPHPDSRFHPKLGAFVQPVHTMTGIIAQEMGEVVRGASTTGRFSWSGWCCFSFRCHQLHRAATREAVQNFHRLTPMHAPANIRKQGQHTRTLERALFLLFRGTPISASPAGAWSFWSSGSRAARRSFKAGRRL